MAYKAPQGCTNKVMRRTGKEAAEVENGFRGSCFVFRVSCSRFHLSFLGFRVPFQPPWLEVGHSEVF